MYHGQGTATANKKRRKQAAKLIETACQGMVNGLSVILKHPHTLNLGGPFSSARAGLQALVDNPLKYSLRTPMNLEDEEGCAPVRFEADDTRDAWVVWCPGRRGTFGTRSFYSRFS